MVNDYKRHKITTGTVLKDAVSSFEYKVRLSPNIEITDEGYLIARNAVVGNIGELQYSERELGLSNNSAKKIRVLREEADVFDEDSLGSLEAKPITILHPKGSVDSENIQDLGKGTELGVPSRDGDNMIADIVVHNKKAVDLIAPADENGIRKLNDNFRDLSLGYKAKLVEVAIGLYKQTNIRYNHLALVPKGRQVNATIVDELQEEVMPKMSIIDKIFRRGKKVLRGEDGNITITGEEVEVFTDEIVREYAETSVEKEKSYNDPEKDIITTRETKVVVEEVDGEKKDEKDKVASTILDENENKDKNTKMEEEKSMVKDKKYFEDELVRLSALPDGEIKVGLLNELNKEFLDAFPQPKVEEPKNQEFKDGFEPIKTEELDKAINDEKPKAKGLRFNDVVKVKADYYNKLTNPMLYDSWEEFDKNYRNESRKGISQYTGI